MAAASATAPAAGPARQIVLDTETTGLSCDAGDRIIELACVELVGRRLTGNDRHYYFNADRESHPDALRVHGLTSDFLRDKPRFESVVDELLDYVAGAEVIIHNAPFDVGFIDSELARLGRPGFAACVHSVTDSLALAKGLFPGRRNSLDALCDRLGVDNSARTLHGALLDARLLADVYINLTRGQEALLIDAAHDAAAATGGAPAIDLRQFSLPVILATDAEAAAHAEVVAQIDKASGGKALWARLVA